MKHVDELKTCEKSLLNVQTHYHDETAIPHHHTNLVFPNTSAIIWTVNRQSESTRDCTHSMFFTHGCPYLATFKILTETLEKSHFLQRVISINSPHHCHMQLYACLDCLMATDTPMGSPVNTVASASSVFLLIGQTIG